MNDQEAQQWATIAHLSALAGLLTGLGFVLGPLIVWLVKRNEHPLVEDQGREALNFQITMFLALIVGGVLTLILVGFLIVFVATVMMIIMPIVAAIKTSNGETYRYPLTIRLVK